MNDPRRLTLADRAIINLDRGLRVALAPGPHGRRPSPAQDLPEPVLDPAERRHVAGLMRVNHAGEIAAQALYHGQAVTARNPVVRETLERAAGEESDHLDWCRRRLDDLGERPSVLDPLWYAGSFLIGAAAGLAGDRLSLGFLAETERQVEAHLDDHLGRLPPADAKSRAVLERMRDEEVRHARTAESAGAASLPRPVRRVMRLVSRVMTRGAYII